MPPSRQTIPVAAKSLMVVAGLGAGSLSAMNPPMRTHILHIGLALTAALSVLAADPKKA